jgi:Zinc finger, C4 type (two domains)
MNYGCKKFYNHWAQACYSCKAFFRRSVKDDAYKKFSCATKNCKIDSKSWRSCKWCRFKKCIGSGLKPSWVLDKTERKRRREKKKKPSAAAAAPKEQEPENALVPLASPASRCSQVSGL